MKTPLSMLLAEKGNNVYSISSSETAHHCAQKMSQFNIGILLVVENDKILGIVSERDIVRKVISPELDPKTTVVADIMTAKVITASLKTTVEEAMHILTEHRFRHLPVTENGELQGLISIGDLTRWVIHSQARDISSLTEYIGGGSR